jgi:hypothetical protein
MEGSGAAGVEGKEARKRGDWGVSRAGPACACSGRAGAGSKGNSTGGPHQCVSRHGRSDAGIRPDVQTLVLSFYFFFKELIVQV